MVKGSSELEGPSVRIHACTARVHGVYDGHVCIAIDLWPINLANKRGLT
jgi:hypothetical protein